MVSRINESRQISIVILVMLVMFLAGACGPILPEQGSNATATSAPTFTPVPPTVTREFVYVTDIPTPLPTPQPPSILTPDAIQVERWKDYQIELAKVLFAFDPDHPEGYDPDAYKDAFCEWDILGQSGQELYLWADCNSANGLVLESNPAVIYIERDGSIRAVNVVRAKPDPRTQFAVYDLHLFPMSVQEILCLYYFFGTVPQCSSITSNYVPNIGLSARERVLISHLEYRRKDHTEEPPLVVLSATSAITPTP
jgi:hypothetical protein